MRVDLTPAFLLHTRAYRETSVILSLFTRDYGQVSVLAKGVRRAKSSLSPLLQAGNALLVSWSGKGEMPTLTGVELLSPASALTGRSSLAILYVNELLYRLLHKGEPFCELFAAYQALLKHLADDMTLATELRLFEKKLIKELGYELQLRSCAETGLPLEADAYYRYVPELGPVLVASQFEKGLVVRGQNLLEFGRDDFSFRQTRVDARKITQLVLDYLLGGRPLYTRELMQQWWENERGLIPDLADVTEN